MWRGHRRSISPVSMFHFTRSMLPDGWHLVCLLLNVWLMNRFLFICFRETKIFYVNPRKTKVLLIQTSKLPSSQNMSSLLGTWGLESQENFDEFMRHIGVGFLLRKMGNQLRPGGGCRFCMLRRKMSGYLLDQWLKPRRSYDLNSNLCR